MGGFRCRNVWLQERVARVLGLGGGRSDLMGLFTHER